MEAFIDEHWGSSIQEAISAGWSSSSLNVRIKVSAGGERKDGWSRQGFFLDDRRLLKVSGVSNISRKVQVWVYEVRSSVGLGKGFGLMMRMMMMRLPVWFGSWKSLTHSQGGNGCENEWCRLKGGCRGQRGGDRAHSPEERLMPGAWGRDWPDLTSTDFCIIFPFTKRGKDTVLRGFSIILVITKKEFNSFGAFSSTLLQLHCDGAVVHFVFVIVKKLGHR